MSPELPYFIPRKLVYRPSEVAEFLGTGIRAVQRLMSEGAFGELKRAGGSDDRPFYKIPYDGLVSYYRDRENPLEN